MVYKYLKEQGLDSTAKKLLKEAKLDSTDAAKSSGNLSTMFESFTKSEKAAKAAAAKVAATKAAAAAKAASSSSSSSSDSDSDSDDDTDSAKVKAVAAKPVAKKVAAKKAASSSDSSSSDSDSEDEAPAKKKPVAAAKPVAKKAAKADSSSSSSDSDSDSDDEDVKMKAPAAPAAKAAAPKAKADSSSSSSDSDSDSDDEVKVHKRKREEDATPAATPIKSAKTTATSTPGGGSGDPSCVRCSGMPYETVEADIHTFFKDCGTISNIDMPLWEDSGRSKGFANLTFGSAAEAQKCIAMNGATMGERWLKIESYVEKPKRTYDNTPSAKPDGCICVFVGNLSYDIDEEQMKTAFKDCGEVTNIRWGMDRETGDFKGFGHVEFSTTEATDKAVAMAGEMILGRAIRVDFAKGKSNTPSRGGAGGAGGARSYGPASEKPEGCKTLFIGNLSFNIDEDSVWKTFGDCGEVIRVKLATDRETGEYRGFGHVEFADTASADKAVATVAGKKIAGREVRIDWAKGRD